MKKLKNKQRGITLIALVLTIIILLILAGISIATLTGENGIITQAQKAKVETKKAEISERLKLEILGSYGADGKFNFEKFQKNLNENNHISGVNVADDGKITYEDEVYIVDNGGELTGPIMIDDIVEVGMKVNGTENKIYINNGIAVIPAGFTVVPGLDNVTEGLVISDYENDTEIDEDESKHVSNGNQFVWVPVSKENFTTEFVRDHFGTEEQKWWTGTFVSDSLCDNNLYEPVADGITVDQKASSSIQEVQKMYKSVRDNGGFYIGRYEVGNDGANNVLCKKGIDVYNNIGWADTDDMNNEVGGAVEKARGFSSSNGYTSVKSTLCYGVQWDAVMRWISKDNLLKGYLTESTSIGNYFDDDDTNNPTKTGEVKEYKLKNIYDLAGNVSEWTMETCNTTLRAIRGGDFGDDGTKIPVSFRNNNFPAYTSNSTGFRVTLYLNN